MPTREKPQSRAPQSYNPHRTDPHNHARDSEGIREDARSAEVRDERKREEAEHRVELYPTEEVTVRFL